MAILLAVVALDLSLVSDAAVAGNVADFAAVVTFDVASGVVASVLQGAVARNVARLAAVVARRVALLT